MREKKQRSDRERLLKLIDGGSSAINQLRQKNLPQVLLRFFSTLGFFVKQSAQEWLEKLRYRGLTRRFTFSLLCNALAVVLSLMLVYLIGDFIGSTLIKRDRVVIAPQTVAPEKTFPAKLKPLDDYLGQMSGRDIFNPQRITLARGEAGSALPSDAFTDLKLVGIDWTADPVALIEDTQTQKTHFLRSGQSIKELKVIEISRDRVKLQNKNKIVELK